MTAGGGGGAAIQAGTEAVTSAGIGGGAALVGRVGTVGEAAGKEEGSREEVWGSEASAGAGARVGVLEG